MRKLVLSILFILVLISSANAQIISTGGSNVDISTSVFTGDTITAGSVVGLCNGKVADLSKNGKRLSVSTSFNVYDGVLAAWCKSCMRRHYAKNNS